MTTDSEDLRAVLADLERRGEAARTAGDEPLAEKLFREGVVRLSAQVNTTGTRDGSQISEDALLLGARLALHAGDLENARQIAAIARSKAQTEESMKAWHDLFDMALWGDAWLVAAARREPPEMPALDELVARHWKTLYARCRLLALDHHRASDLAQQAWCRILRARQDLRPGGNFRGYLLAAATNLWRDSLRSSQRAGPLSDQRLSCLDEVLSTDAESSTALRDVLPDAKSIRARDTIHLRMDIDRALAQLSPLMREVLVCRLISGESCASIGARHGRTEQTVSGWVREAIREMKRLLEEPVEREPQNDDVKVARTPSRSTPHAIRG
ncbi:MAG: sigma-70 family RNA polymerase sigma factor [Opitutaceae bacterium]|nr:sigma-70 family RNA polymerase sigma factor [Opitutaceae bacterium]